MIPVLYDGSETNFNHNGLGFLVDVDSKSIYVERERNGNQLLVMKYPENGAKVEGLVKGNIIKADASPKRKGQLFRIYYIKKDIKDMILVYAKHILFDAKHDTLLSPINESLSCVEALNKLKMNCVFSLKKFTMESDLLTTAYPFVQSNNNILDCIMGTEGSVLSSYGSDPDLVIDNFKLKVTQNGGVDSSVLIAYTKNMDGYTMEEDCDTLITGIIPYVSYNDGGTEVSVKGDLVWSDKKNNYDHPYVTHMNFTDNFIDKATNTFRKPSVDELNRAAKDYILSSRCDVPKMTYTISFVPLAKTEEYKNISAMEELDLLDKVIIHNHKYNVRDKAKIIKTKYNPVKETFISMTLGDPRSTLQGIFNTSGSKLDSVANKVDNVITGGIPPKFPDTLPTVPVLKVDTSGLKTISLSWTFDNKIHYTYRLYASRQKDFIPTIFDLVFEGQASTYLHEVDYNQIWYYRVEAINSYGRSTGPSNQVMGATVKISDAATIFEEAAIGDALIANLRADRAWVGQFKAENINFRNATCTDGNDQTTFSIDSFGRVRIIATEFMLQGKTIDNIIQEETATTVKNVNPMFYLSDSETELIGGQWMDIAPPWTNGKYMWTKTVTTLGDNSTRETPPTCISGAIGPQGKPGIDGSDGVNGKDGVSLVYKGEFTSHPSNPQDGWYYRNTAQGKTFVYQSGAWYQMTIDGKDGADGASIEYKGELDNPPANPQKNWTYRDKQNGILYIYNGSAWAVMVRDGNDGTPGTPGNNGLSVFCTYHDGENKPTTPTGDGTTGGWHTNWTANVIWLSQKVSSSVTSGSWGAPIKIAGEDGVSVLSVTEQFFLSNSKDHQPEENASGWVDGVCPPWEPGKYIWTRIKITLSNNTVKYTGYHVDTTWEIVTELQISDRNLLLDSDKFITSGSVPTTFDVAKDFIAKFNENLGKRMYLSLEINANNAISTAVSGVKRLGCEIALIFEDETASYIGAWQQLGDTPLNCTNLRISRAYDIPHKKLKEVTYCGLYIQGLTSGTVKIGRPKLQISDKVTDWSPAPEDVKKDIADVSGALNKLDTSVKDAFGDGIINDSEAKALASNIQILDNEKADIDRQYTTLINNHLLTGTVKTNLTNSKTAYDSAHASLKSGINTAISDKRITDSERNSVNSFFSTYRSKLADFKQRVQEALDAVGQQRVEGIEIGGRNLLKGSGELVTNNNYLVKSYKVSELLKEGDTYTVSLCVTPADKVSNFGVYFSQGYSQVASLITQGNTKQVLTKTFKMKYDPDRVPTNIDSINAECRVHRFPNNGTVVGNSTIHWIQIEKGTKATDWSPAPEDVIANIKDVSDALGGLDSAVKKAFGDNIVNSSEAMAIQSNIQILNNEKADIDQEYNALYNNKDLTGNAKTNLADAKSLYNRAHNALVTTIMTAIGDLTITSSERSDVDAKFTDYASKLGIYKQRVQQALDAISIKRVDEIQLGGVNLQRNADFEDGFKYWQAPYQFTLDKNKKYKGTNSAKFTRSGLTSDNSQFFYNNKNLIPAYPNEDYTFSTYLYTDYAAGVDSGGVNLFVEFFNSSNVSTGLFSSPSVTLSNGSWVRSTISVKAPANTAYVIAGIIVRRNGTLWLCRPQLERGNRASDWSVSQHDLKDNITDVSNSLGTLDTAIKNAFGDNIINDSEAKAIASNIQILDNEKADIDKEYTIIYGNAKLTGTPKTNLYNAKNEYNTAHSSLKSTINSATADRQITDSERNSVNNAFATYRTRLADYKQRVQEALDAIGNKRVDDIQLGVRNILKNGNINFTSSNYIMITKYTSVKLVNGRKYTIVMKAKTTGGQKIRVSMNNGSDLLGYMPGNQNGVAYFTFTAVTPTSVDYENAIKFHNYPESGASYNPATINWVCVYEGEIKPPLDWTPTPEEIQSAIDRKVENNQLAIFNSLTNNGQTQGIYLSNSKIYINGEYIKANSINVDRLKAGTFKGNAFFTAADSSATDGYAFRIYSDGRVYSKKAIQVYGTREDGDYSQISATRINTTGYVQCSGYTTDNATLFIAVDGADVNHPTGDNGRRIKLYRNTTEGVTYFMPDYDGSIRLGTTNKKWKVVYAKDGVSTTSDRRLKENIRYVDSEPNTITPQMMLEFIMQDYILAQYNYIDDPLDERISAIAQDLLVKENGEESKVGQLIVNNQEALYNKKENGPGYLSMNQTQLLNVFIGAFQQFVIDVNKKFEQLKS